MIDEVGAALTLTYAWLKAGHLIFVIFWVAGLFMLPRYYIYHQESAPGSDEEERWSSREKRLRNIIMTPAMVMVWVLGLALAWTTDAWVQGWFLAKAAIVIALTAYHGWMVGYGRRLSNGGSRIPGRTLRMMNEVPGIATVLIVVLVIVRPF